MTAPARVQQTPGWLRDQIPDLLGLATALTGSAEAAADLVVQTIIRTPPRLSRQPAAETADDDLLALLVGRFLATHRRRTAGVAAAGPLGALSPPARAAVVLRDGRLHAAAEHTPVASRSLRVPFPRDWPLPQSRAPAAQA